MIVFLISGLWHGAGWTFVLWGAYHGLILIIENLLGMKKYKDVVTLSKKPKGRIEIMKILITFIIINIGWIIFRADSWGELLLFFRSLFSNYNIPFSIQGNNIKILALASIFLIIVDYLYRKLEFPFQNIQHIPVLYYVIFFMLIISCRGGIVDFIYFKF